MGSVVGSVVGPVAADLGNLGLKDMAGQLAKLGAGGLALLVMLAVVLIWFEPQQLLVRTGVDEPLPAPARAPADRPATDPAVRVLARASWSGARTRRWGR